MPLPKLTLRPDQAGYSVGDPDEIVATKLDGGASRQRRDVLGGALPVTAQWTLGPTEYAAWQDFVRDATGYGAEPFLCDLILDGASLQECKAQFVPRSRKLVSHRGLTYVVGAQLEVIHGAQTTVPAAPVLFPLPSPSIADDIPIAGTCDWTTDTVQVLVDGVLTATVVPVGRAFSVLLGGIADGVHTVTALAANTAGTSVASEGVSFYQGAAAEAATYTFDGLELFED